MKFRFPLKFWFCVYFLLSLSLVRVFQIGVAFYEMLQAVDQQCQHLSYMDPICDFLYHIKYMYTGDSVKEQVRKRSTKKYLPLRKHSSPLHTPSLRVFLSNLLHGSVRDIKVTKTKSGDERRPWWPSLQQRRHLWTRGSSGDSFMFSVSIFRSNLSPPAH